MNNVYRKVIIIGAVLIVLNITIFLIGLFGLSFIDELPIRNFLLGTQFVFVPIFIILTYIIIRTVHHNTILLFEQQSSLSKSIKSNERSINQLQVAADIARDATAQKNLQGVLDHTVQLICERFNFYHAGIFLIDQETNYAVIRAAYGVEASQDMLKRGHKLKVGEEGIVGFVTSTGIARIVMDTAEDAYHFKNPVLPETCSEMALPFRVHDRIIGALDVQSKKRGAFDQDDVHILQTMADLLAVAIDKANLNETVQAYADELELRVQERTKQLETEHAQLQAILNGMTDGVIYDELLTIIYTNKAFTNMTGYSDTTKLQGLLKSLKPKSMSDEEINQIEQDLFDQVEQLGVWSKDMKLARADGTEFEANIVSTGVKRKSDAKGVDGAVTIIRDISERKALEEQKSRFIANAAHELRTPLTNLKTRLYLIRHQPDRFHEHYEVLKNVTGRMQRLIDDLLDMSRFEQGKIKLTLQKMDIRDLVHDVVETQRPEAEAKSLKLVSNIIDMPLYVEVDYDRMIQVMTNLISNAINYTEKGKITVHLQPHNNDQIEICVEDTGIGIKPDMLDNIFQPFIRAQNMAKGTGLGLNIAREIVHLHNGKLEVKSTFGKGSKFFIRLHNNDHISSV